MNFKILFQSIRLVRQYNTFINNKQVNFYKIETSLGLPDVLCSRQPDQQNPKCQESLPDQEFQLLFQFLSPADTLLSQQAISLVTALQALPVTSLWRQRQYPSIVPVAPG